MQAVKKVENSFLLHVLEQIKPGSIHDGFFCYFKKRLVMKTENSIVSRLLRASFTIGVNKKEIPFGNEDMLIALIEILDTAIIVYDDIIDSDCEFHDEPAKLLLNIDCLIYSTLDKILNISDSKTFLYIFCNLKECINGEAADVNLTLKPEITEDIYFEKIVKKSTKLFRLYLLGYPAQRAIFGEIAEDIAISFQIRNDVRNICGLLKSDIQKRKPSLPMIKAQEYAMVLNFNFDHHLNQFISGTNRTSLLEFIDCSKSIEYCTFLCQYYREKAMKQIKLHFDNHAEALIELIIRRQ